MKAWQKGPDNILFDSIKMTALMSFCFGVGLLASSIIGVGPRTQLALVESVEGGSTTITSSTSLSTATSDDTSISGSPDTTNTQVQTTTSTTNTTTNTTTNQTSATGGTLSYYNPSISFTSAVPSVVASDFAVTLNAVGIYRPQLIVRGLNVNKFIVLDPVSQQKPFFNYVVRFSQLPPGRYELMAKGVIENGSLLEVIGPKFEIMATTSVTSSQTTNTLDSGSTSSTTSTITNTESGSVVSTSSSISNTSIASTTQTYLENHDEVKIPDLDLIIPSQEIYRGFVPVQVRTTVSIPEAFIYLQSPNILSPRFIGKARYYDNTTLLMMIDTNQLPNGEHRIYASTRIVDVNVESEKRRFVIYNSSTTTAITSTTTKPSVLSPTASTTIQPTVLTPTVLQPKPAVIEPITLPAEPVYVPPKIAPREIDNVNNLVEPERAKIVENSPKTVVLTDALKTLIPLVLKEYESEINQRLKTFGEDLHAKEVDIDKLRNEVEDNIMLILLGDYRLRSISSEAKKRLRIEVERLVYRAQEFELLIKKSEITPESLDELVRTFKSSTTTVEDNLVDTSSPREFGLVREDILKIESVSPVVSTEAKSTTTKIYTEIRGKAVPNSLVTLYIYSTPVMVTVRADADGTFVYVYEKDLEDGDHEVYVALTTTEGEVVVKSPGFQFIRQAEAFNSPDSANGDSLVPATAGTPLTRNPFFIVISITLLVVSFIFFLLGFKTSKKTDDFTVV